jgi:hypothetical protein
MARLRLSQALVSRESQDVGDLAFRQVVQPTHGRCRQLALFERGALPDCHREHSARRSSSNFGLGRQRQNGHQIWRARVPLLYNCACSPTLLSREADICRTSLSTRGFVKGVTAERGRWVNKSTGQRRIYSMRETSQSRPYVNARPRHGRHPISLARPIDQAVDVLGRPSTSRHLRRSPQEHPGPSLRR